MDLNTYFEQYPQHPFLGNWDRPGVIRSGVIQFTPETACAWGGPFEGGVAGYVLMDTRLWNPKGYRPPFVESQQKALTLIQGWIAGRPRAEDKALYLEWLSRAEDGDADVVHLVTEYGTAEHPYRIWMFGNDDTSYSRWFATQEEAEDFVALMEAAEPLDFVTDFLPFGWTFTN